MNKIEMIHISGNREIKDFYISNYLVSQEKWEKIMNYNYSMYKGSNFPVVNVTSIYIREFIQKLNYQTNENFRLPTSAEWKYACRAGTTTQYYWGDNEDEYNDYAWCCYNSNNETHDVGLKKPNAWGLYDMCGNVWEWCYNEDDNTYNILGGSCISYHPIRGCLFNSDIRSNTFYASMDLGFRLAKSKI